MALDNYRGTLPEEQLGGDVENHIKAFFIARIKNILSEEGVRYDVIDAALNGEWRILPILEERAKALMAMRKDQAFAQLLTGFTRAYNLAKKSEETAVDPNILEDPAEKRLYESLQNVGERLTQLSSEAVSESSYIQVIQVLSQLAEPVNAFFDAVMVMSEDLKLRDSRIGLLKRMVELSSKFIGDLSKITD